MFLNCIWGGGGDSEPCYVVFIFSWPPVSARKRGCLCHSASGLARNESLLTPKHWTLWKVEKGYLRFIIRIIFARFDDTRSHDIY